MTKKKNKFGKKAFFIEVDLEISEPTNVKITALNWKPDGIERNSFYLYGQNLLELSETIVKLTNTLEIDLVGYKTEDDVGKWGALFDVIKCNTIVELWGVTETPAIDNFIRGEI